jgi:hypothetical protein
MNVFFKSYDFLEQRMGVLFKENFSLPKKSDIPLVGYYSNFKILPLSVFQDSFYFTIQK